MKHSLLLLLSFGRLSGYGQEIFGTVVNSNRELLCNAAVVAKQGGLIKSTTLTDSLGKYSMAKLDPGYYDVIASYPGYKKTTRIMVMVSSGERTGLNFTILPDNYQEIHGRIIHNKKSVVQGNTYPVITIKQKKEKDTVIIATTETRFEGFYSTGPLEPGEYFVTATYPGYKTMTITNVIVLPRNETELNFEMLPDSNPKPVTIKYKKYLRKLKRNHLH